MAYSRNRYRKVSEISTDNISRKTIRKYNTPKFKKILDEDRDKYTVDYETWSMGDRLYKYARKYYGDEKYWWVISWYNNKPTESHFNQGDVFAVPSIQILQLLDYE